MPLKLFFAILLLCLSAGYTSKAQFLKADYTINYKPHVRAFWTTYNRDIDKPLSTPGIKPNYDSVVKAMLKAFELMEPYNEDIYILSSVFHSMKDYNNTVKYYLMALAKGYLPLEDFRRPQFILENDTIPQYKTLAQKLDSFAMHAGYTPDINFCELVIELYTIDKHTRKIEFFKQDKLVKTDSGFLYRYFGFHDSINLRKLLAHIDKYGIPHRNKITPKAQDAFFLVVHHLVQDVEDKESVRLYQLVKAAIEDGRLENKFLKPAIDYMQWRIGGQYFGTVCTLNANGKYELNPPLIQPETVDDRRRDWGFEPLYQMMKSRYDTNFVLPRGYVFKDQY